MIYSHFQKFQLIIAIASIRSSNLYCSRSPIVVTNGMPGLCNLSYYRPSFRLAISLLISFSSKQNFSLISSGSEDSGDTYFVIAFRQLCPQCVSDQIAYATTCSALFLMLSIVCKIAVLVLASNIFMKLNGLSNGGFIRILTSSI